MQKQIKPTEAPNRYISELQNRIDKLESLYLSNSTLKNYPLNSFRSQVYDKGFYILGSKESENTSKRLFLASIPKMVYLKLLPKDLKFEVEIDVILEIISRGHSSRLKRISEYKCYLEMLEREGKYHLFERTLAGEEDDTYEKLKQVSQKMFSDKKITISGEEIAYITWVYSCNNSLKVIKNYLEKELDLEKAFEKLAPGYTMLKDTTYSKHYFENCPNVGFLESFVDIQATMVTEYSKDGKGYVGSYVNKKSDTGFDFLNSELGLDLQERGFKIVEKSGYFPCHTWVYELAKKDAPYMVFLDIFTIIDTDDVVYKSFGFYFLVEVIFPKERKREVLQINGKDYSFTYPSAFTSSYKDYVNGIKERWQKEFRFYTNDFVKNFV